MKGKPDRHATDPTRVRDREIPVLSFDFSYTGKSMTDGDEDDGVKPTTLVMHDPHTRSIGCFPLKAKDDAKHAVREMIKHVQYLGQSRMKPPPSTAAVLDLLRQIWFLRVKQQNL